MAKVFTRKAVITAIVFVAIICLCAVLAYAAFTSTKIGDKGLYPPPDR